MKKIIKILALLAASSLLFFILAYCTYGNSKLTLDSFITTTEINTLFALVLFNREINREI